MFLVINADEKNKMTLRGFKKGLFSIAIKNLETPKYSTI